VGDPLAKKMFKSELIARYERGTDRTREFIERSGAFKYLSLEEMLNLLLNTEDLVALTELAEEVWTESEPNDIVQALITQETVRLENRKIVELDFSGFDLELEEFPKSVLKLKNLKMLALTGNYFKVIPENISDLGLLKELWLDNNEISHLPDSICETMVLEKMEVNGNKINILPENIGNLTSLKVLGLARNEITELPESFYNLKSLETLSLADNRLESLPKSFCNLTSLNWLDISNNNLTKLPKCFINLPSLEYLDVSKNPFTENTNLIEEIKKRKLN